MRHTCTIAVANNYLRIYDYPEEFTKRILLPFCRTYLALVGQVPHKDNPRIQVMAVTHRFARFNHDQTELRITSSLLEELKQFITSRGYAEKRINIINEPEIIPYPIDLKFKEGIGTPLEKQIEWLEYLNGPGHIKLNNMPTGDGKSQTLNSLIKIPNGWKRMGDMKVGDKVIARDGTTTRVTGVFPQGKTKVYRVHFVDGRYVDCNPEHLWKVHDHGDCRKIDNGLEHPWKIKTTQEIKEKLENNRHTRPYIPLCLSEQNEDKHFTIHPYVMGVLLGDGGMSGGSVTITKPYQQLFDKVQSLLPEYVICKWRDVKTFILKWRDKYKQQVVELRPDLFVKGSYKNPIKDELIKLNLMGKRSWEKWIPEEYFNGSTEQRWQLLQGLMDTDGCVGLSMGRDGVKQSKNGTPSFSSSSEQLAKGVQRLVWSLGGICKLSTRVPHYTYKGERLTGRTDYRLFIRMPEPEKIFTLDHKKERANKTQYSDVLKLKIKHIEEREEEETQCISVEHPEHLYVTDNYVVTHNTFCSFRTAVNLGCRIVVIANARFLPIWRVECGNLLDIKPEDYIETDVGGLDDFLDALKKGIINPKITVISLTKIGILLKKNKDDPTHPDLDDVFRELRPGLRIYDEAHESIHQVYMSMMFGNIPLTIANTATIKAEDSFTNKIYEYLYPKQYRLKDTEYRAHMHVKALNFRIDMRKHRIQTISRGVYNDITFEASIMNNKKLRPQYIAMAIKMFEDYYYHRREEGTKCLFFFVKKETCKIMAEAFKKKYPDLDVISFTGDQGMKAETKEEYRKHEFVISTPGSCGTGKDIKGLITCISFHNVKSNQRNYQMRGRIRPIKKGEWDHIERIFGYTVCRDIDKHRSYHKYRRELFEDSSLSYQIVDTGFFLQ